MKISTKIAIPFIISLFLILFGNLWFNYYFEKIIESHLTTFYISSAKKILPEIDNNEKFHLVLKSLGIKIVTLEELKGKELINSEYVQNEPDSIRVVKLHGEDNDEDDIFCLIEHKSKTLLLQKVEPDEHEEREIIDKIFYLAILILLLLYFFIIKLLSPINKITKEIERFSKGDFNRRLKAKGSDEIGMLASSFNNMAEKIKNLIESKDALLRDVGHELQTPIAKCKFALERVPNNENKEDIKQSLNQLELLVNTILKFKHIEHDNINLSTFDMETLLAQTLSTLYIEKEEYLEVEIEENFKIHADIFYLGLALKNLIENALKYASNYPIKIIVKKDCLVVQNYAKALSQDIEYYLKPFSRENNIKKGYGLGLNIVKKILDKHNYKLEYKYIDSKHQFKILFKV